MSDGEEVNICLINPPMVIPKGITARCVPPMGLAYLATELRDNGHHVKIIDMVAQYYENTEEIYTGFRHEVEFVSHGATSLDWPSLSGYDVVGITVPLSSCAEMVMDMANEIKHNAYKPPMIAVGGIHPSLYPEDFRVPDIDYVASDVDGFIDWVGRTNPKGYPWFWETRPAFDLLNIEKYFEINVPMSPVPKGNRVLPIMASVGCPMKCNFCAIPAMYSEHEMRETEDVISQIQLYQNRYGIDEIQFIDDNLTVWKGRAKELFKSITPLNINWCTPNGIMINTLDSEMLELMAESGCYNITLSVDSGSVAGLKKQGKTVKLDTVPGIVDKCRELGMTTHGTLVVGMPGETRKEIQESMDWVMDNCHFTSISTFCAWPIPGSRLYNEMVHSGQIGREDAWMINTTKSILPLGFPNEELAPMVDRFQREFSIRARDRHPFEHRKKYGEMVDYSDDSGRLA